MSNADCSKEVHYGKRITENMFCAASPDWSTDACKVRTGRRVCRGKQDIWACFKYIHQKRSELEEVVT